VLLVLVVMMVLAFVVVVVVVTFVTPMFDAQSSVECGQRGG